MTIDKFIKEVKMKMITIENQDGKPLSGWQLSGILLDTNYKYRIRSVVTSNDGKILRVDCLIKANEK
jgi:hypothetical protein